MHNLFTSFKHSRFWVIVAAGLLLSQAACLGISAASRAAAAEPATAATRPATAPPTAAAWPPPMPAADPNKSVRENLCDLLNYLASEAGKRPDLLLLAHHFRSLELVVREDGLTREQYKDQNGTVITSTTYLRQLYDAFTKDWEHGAANWQTYLDGRPLMFAWKSPYDGTISIERVVLPKNYKPNVRYPLYFELHGASPSDSPLQRLIFATRNAGFSNESQRRDGFHVMPWARGLSEYHGAGLLSLGESLGEVDAYLNTDPARQYLFGFSMGGGGAWNFGADSIKQRGWAAIGIYSGTVMPHAFEAAQLKDTPIWMRCGETDPWRHDGEAMNKALIAAGNTPDFAVLKGVGHSYLGEQQEKMLDFLNKHTNPRPVLAPSHLVTLHARGDDFIENLYVNGRRIELNGNLGLARMHDGQNVVAAHVQNRLWAGEFCLAATLPDGKPLATDASWKCTTHAPGLNWHAPGFQDASWPKAEAICAFDRAGWYQPSPSNEPFKASGAYYLGPPARQCYRKEFQSAGGDGNLLIRGMGMTYNIWLNGREIAQGDFSPEAMAARGAKGYDKQAYKCTTQKGRNVLAIEIVSKQPKCEGNLWKLGFFYPDAEGKQARVGSGAGWQTMADAPDRWFLPEFDDIAWARTDESYINSAYDAGSDGSGDGTFSAYFVNPGSLYFRKTFTVGPGQ